MAVVAQILLPMIFAIAAIAVAESGSNNLDFPSRLFAPSNNYGSNTGYRSARDLGSDTWSVVTNATQYSYSVLGSLPISPQQTAMNSAVNSFVSSDWRTSNVHLTDASNENLTDVMLLASADYLSNNWFTNNLYSFSFEDSIFYVKAGANGDCLFDDGNGNYAPTNLQLADYGTYLFIQHLYDASSLVMMFYYSSDLTGPINSPTVSTQVYSTPGGPVFVAYSLNLQVYHNTIYFTCSSSAPASAASSISVVKSPSIFNATGITAYAWFSEKEYHTPGESLNILNNALLRYFINSSDAAIYTYNYPLPKQVKDQINSLKTSSAGFNLALFMIFGLGFLMSSFSIFLVSERVSKSKHIQFVSGLDMPVYWLANFVWDLAIFLFPAITIVIIFAAFNFPAFTSGNNLGVVFLLIMLCGWQTLPMVYVASFFFDTPSSAYARLSMLFIFAGLGFLVAVFVTAIPSFSLLSTSNILKQIGFILPNYAAAQALLDMFYNDQYNSICYVSTKAYSSCVSQGTIPQPMFSTTFPGIGRHIAFMVSYGAFFLLVLIAVEYGIVNLINSLTNADHYRGDEDEDVANERHRIEDSAPGTVQDTVIVNNVSRMFRVGGRTLKAVDHLSFGIPGGECFGLLGVNGAGKTTTFRMLTGELPMSSGLVVINGFDLGKDLRMVRRYIGYCPQYNGLIDLMTGAEILRFFARLRGVPEHQIEDTVLALIHDFDLKKHANKPSGTYSGGNKRKLSTAIALVGDPPVVFLDEPTSVRWKGIWSLEECGGW